jgi:Tat protein translocase TatC
MSTASSADATRTDASRAKSSEELPRMSFGDHLDELRKRLLISFGAVAVAMLAVLPFKQSVTSLYVAPYERMWFWAYETFLEDLDRKVEESRQTGVALHPEEQEIVDWHAKYSGQILDGSFPEELHNRIYTVGGFDLPRTLKALGGLEDFWTFMAATMLFALILAGPVVLWQAWSFVAAGLYRHERKVVMRYLPLSLGLFATGVCFGYFVVVPMGLYFLIQLMYWAKVTSMMSVGLYFSFLLTLTLALGVVFQLPLVMLAVHKIGLVSHEALRKNWRYIVLGFFTLSAMITPPDPFTQLLMAGPMVVLYIIGLILTGRSARRMAAETAA